MTLLKNGRFFTATDPFNNNNIVEGIIFNSNDRYGDLLIKSVNGVSCEQYIHTTPKVFYPSDTISYPAYLNKIETNEFNLPDYDEVIVYNKYDGTNICLFSYKDAEGVIYRSFKTRLTPFLRPSLWGSWIEMWKRCMKNRPIDALISQHNINFSFELYGYLNPILTEYKIPLDSVLLFGIDNGEIIIPHEFVDKYSNIANIVYKFSKNDNFHFTYEELRSEMNKTIEREGYVVEGCVLYGIKDNKVVFVYKCKPDLILQNIRNSPNRIYKISYKTIYNTCINALESFNGGSLEDETIKLLKEEFTDETIERSKEVINKATKDIKKYLELRTEVLKWYKKQNYDKFIPKKVMPEAVKKFGKKLSTTIYKILSETTFYE